MSYGILLWGKAADIQSIFVLQKRAIRSIYNMKSRDSLRERFKELNILTVASQYIYENLMYARKNICNFPKKCDIHNINTRNKYKRIVPNFRLQKVSGSFMGNCIRFFNKLPEGIEKLPIRKYKSFIKINLMKKAYYTINDYVSDKSAWPECPKLDTII